MRGELDLAAAGGLAGGVTEHANIFIGGERAGLFGFIARYTRGKLKSPAERLNIGNLNGHVLLDAGSIGVRIDDDPARSLIDRRRKLVVTLGTGLAAVGSQARAPDRLPVARCEKGNRGG